MGPLDQAISIKSIRKSLRDAKYMGNMYVTVEAEGYTMALMSDHVTRDRWF